MLRPVSDARLASAIRALRIRRGWRQEDLASRAEVSRSFVSVVERGHVETISIHSLRRVCAALDVRLDLVPRWRGGDLDRLLNARHAAMHESFGGFLRSQPGWDCAPEVSFSIYGERGVIDILAWHEASRALLVIELKTEIVDPQEIAGTLDRKRRLAPVIARDRGWDARLVGTWLVIAEGSTNRRRVEAHRTLFSSALPHDARMFRGWLRSPSLPADGLMFWSYASRSSASRALVTPRRVRRRTSGATDT
jgi:transcriptional regulator with XRE-family HTH domain